MEKVIIFLALCAVATAYTNMDDSLNLDELIKNRAELKKQLDCFLDRTECSARDIEYKKNIPEVVDDGCQECNPIEKHMFRIFVKGMKKEFPEDYDLFAAKYDPEDKHLQTTIEAVKDA